MKVFVLMAMRDALESDDCSDLISVFGDRSEADNKVIEMMEVLSSKRQGRPFWRKMKELGLEYRYERLYVVEQEVL